MSYWCHSAYGKAGHVSDESRIGFFKLKAELLFH